MPFGRFMECQQPTCSSESTLLVILAGRRVCLACADMAKQATLEPYTCLECNELVQPSDREFHQEIVHHPNWAALAARYNRTDRIGSTMVDRRRFHCWACSVNGKQVKFFSQKDLSTHKRLKHPIRCSRCRKAFPSESAMFRHLERETRAERRHAHKTLDPLIQPIIISSQ